MYMWEQKLLLCWNIKIKMNHVNVWWFYEYMSLLPFYNAMEQKQRILDRFRANFYKMWMHSERVYYGSRPVSAVGGIHSSTKLNETFRCSIALWHLIYHIERTFIHNIFIIYLQEIARVKMATKRFPISTLIFVSQNMTKQASKNEVKWLLTGNYDWID